MNFKKHFLAVIVTLLLTHVLFAQSDNQVEILLVGFDHLSQMDNGTPTSNIFSAKKQQEIKLIADKLAAFKPTMIMVEKEPDEQEMLDSLFMAYKNGNLELSDIENGASETYQVGFRLAKKLGLNGAKGIDHYESTSQSLLSSGENIEIFKNGLQLLMKIARPMKAKVQQDSLSIYQYIKIMNRDKLIDLTHKLIFNMPAYVMNGEFSENATNTVDIGEIDNKYIGAEYITLFYNRNLKIYTNILNTQLKYKAERIVLFMGQLHIGVLRDLLKDNSKFKIIKASEYFD